MKELLTSSLRLIPYDEASVELAIHDQPAAARGIGAEMAAPTLKEHRFMSKIYSAKLEIMRRCPQAWLLCTYWQLIPRHGPPVVVGAAGFKGPPVNGEVEIGYGVQAPYRNMGFVTEAVSALCRFVFTQDEFPASGVLAVTDRDNIASQRVLKKCGFQLQGYGNELLSWRLKNDGFSPGPDCVRQETGRGG